MRFEQSAVGAAMVWRSVLTLTLAIAVWANTPRDARSAEPDVDVTVQRLENGDWSAEYRFSRSAPVWVFVRSGLTSADHTPWRPKAWTIETPGVRLERRGRYDALTGDGTPLTTVRIRFRPFGEDLDRDYVPSLTFADGSLAHFTDQFRVAPLDAEGDPNGELQKSTSRLTFRDPGRRLLFQGALSLDQVVTTTDARAYVYFGDTALTETDTLAAVVDPALPEWIRTELRDFSPRLLAYYAERLGPPRVHRPTMFAAWGGADLHGLKFDGGVINGAMLLDIRGDQAGEPGHGNLERIRWLYGHETVHFWLGDTARNERASQAWIMEGGSDVLALRALQRLMPKYEARVAAQEKLDECLKLTQPHEPLAGAAARGEPQAFYGCGAVLLLAAEAGLRKREPDADAFTFWRRLIDANREDGVVTAGEWLAAFEETTGDPALTTEVEAFLTEGVADPTVFVERLFARTGVAHSVGADGKLKLGAN